MLAVNLKSEDVCLFGVILPIRLFSKVGQLQSLTCWGATPIINVLAFRIRLLYTKLYPFKKHNREIDFPWFNSNIIALRFICIIYYEFDQKALNFFK